MQAGGCVHACREWHHLAHGGSAEDAAMRLVPWDLGREQASRLAVWRHDCEQGGALKVAIAQDQENGDLAAGSTPELVSKKR